MGSELIVNIPDKGLVIKQPWIELILSGKKPWEMRSRRTKIRGRIALIEQGTGLIVGEAYLVDSLPPLPGELRRKYESKHCITDYSLLEKWRYPWVLIEVKRYDAPIPYQHPKGAVVWVNLEK